MRYRLLGRSGLRVSELCLGTMTFGTTWDWGSDEEQSHRILGGFADAGGTWIDTADFYQDGESETIIGRWLHGQPRDRYVVATKYTDSAPTDDPNASGNSRKHMRAAVEGSLRRLGTDHIDVYWVHSPDFMTPIDEVVRGLDDLVTAGKVLYVGVSDAPAWWLARAVTMAELRGWARFVGLQIEYSLVERTPDRELLPAAQALDVGVVAWSPLADGVLTGKYAAEAAGQRRLDRAPFREIDDRTAAVADAVAKAAAHVGATPAQVALAWVRHRGVSPIFGARTPEQLHDNVRAADLALPPDVLADLDAASAVGPGFPLEFLSRPAMASAVYGGMLGQIDSHRPEQMPEAVRAIAASLR